MQTNDARNRFYGQLLPNVLNELQRMEETRIGLLLQSIREMVAKERDIAPIVAKCVDSIEEEINNVAPEGDTALVAEKFKVHFHESRYQRIFRFILRVIIRLNIHSLLFQHKIRLEMFHQTILNLKT